MGTQVASAFMTLLGPDVARLCDEVELRSGTLLVTTSSPALAHQLRLDAQTILGRLNRPVRTAGRSECRRAFASSPARIGGSWRAS